MIAFFEKSLRKKGSLNGLALIVRKSIKCTYMSHLFVEDDGNFRASIVPVYSLTDIEEVREMCSLNIRSINCRTQYPV